MIATTAAASRETTKAEKAFMVLVWFSIGLLTLDLIYKSWFGITYETRENCIIYGNLPRPLFLIYEYFVEMFLLVVVSVFVASLVEKWLYRVSRFLPKNSLTAFIYASILPVCACGAVPLIRAMRGTSPTRAIITFLVAAPLLNPYVILLSLSVLGVKMTLARVLGSFVLSAGCGWLLRNHSLDAPSSNSVFGCPGRGKEGCHTKGATSVYGSAFGVFRKIWIYVFIAGALGVLFELLEPARYLESLQLRDTIWGPPIFVAVGLPLYFCNGADVLFLQPLMQYTDLSIGTAIAFSLSSTAICISSAVLTARYIGWRVTSLLLLYVFIGSSAIGIFVNLL